MAKQRKTRSRPRMAIASGGRNPLTKLPSAKVAFVNARVDGATIRAASAEAGVRKEQGGKWERSDDVKAAYRWLMSRVMPIKKMVELVRDGCYATIPVWGPDGKRRKDRPDWRARHPFIKMAVEQAGYHDPVPEAGGASFVNITVRHLGGAPGEHRNETDPAAAETARAQHLIAAKTDGVA
jgi:hypothetical protein